MSNKRIDKATYDDPLVITYAIAMTALQTAAEKGRFRGPPGMKGRLISLSGTITTTVTTGTAPVVVGSGSDADAYLTTGVPVGVAPLGFQATRAQLRAGGAVDEIPADTDVIVAVSGAVAGAGAATAYITVAWYQ